MRDDDVQMVYRTGHALDDVKATLSRDVSLSVGGISIEGKQAEVISLPLWAGRCCRPRGWPVWRCPTR